MTRLFYKAFPRRLRRPIHQHLQERKLRIKSPKMIYGFMDSTGLWRERTRVGDSVFFNHIERISIADNVYIGHFCILDGTGGLIIDEGCQVAGWNGIYTHSSHVSIRLYGSHYQEVHEDEKIGFRKMPVRLEKYVFVGAGAKIFPGVNIGKGALIHANSIVTKNVEAFAVVAGQPAKNIGDTRDLDKKYLQENDNLREWYAEWQSD